MADEKTVPRFVQLCVGQWTRNKDKGFTVIGLGEDGKVYTWIRTQGGWTVAPSRVVRWKPEDKRRTQELLNDPSADEPF